MIANLEGEMLLRIVKLSMYAGAILVTVFVALTGIFELDAPYAIFYVGMFFVVFGVLLGNYHVLVNARKQRK